MVTVVITPEAAGQIEELPLTIRTRMLGVMARLERWPDVSGAKPLRGDLAGRYRVRTGDYRVQFHLAGGTIVVERVGHRDGFYD